MSPMCRVDIDVLAGRGIDPAGVSPPAAKHQRMRIVSLDHGELDVTIERCSADRMPRGIGHGHLRDVGTKTTCLPVVWFSALTWIKSDYRAI